jgi:hypothetical protein
MLSVVAPINADLFFPLQSRTLSNKAAKKKKKNWREKMTISLLAGNENLFYYYSLTSSGLRSIYIGDFWAER